MVSFLSIALAFAVTAGAQHPNSRGKDANDNDVPWYSPVRAPALPLAVRSPYTSTWVSTVNNGTLNSNGAIFWNGDPLGWEGIITVDDISYEYFGTGMSGLPVLKRLKKAKPHSVSYDSHYSNFSLDAGLVRVTASFFSPVLPKDYCRSSVPLSYFEASFESIDGAAHDVQLYSDVNAAWISHQGSSTLHWTLYRGSTEINGTGNVTATTDTVYKWLVNVQRPYVFAESNDHPQWGNLSYASTPGKAKKFSFESGASTDMRYKYIADKTLNNLVDKSFRGASQREPVFAFSHDFGSSFSGSAMYTVGTIHSPLIKLITSAGILGLQPWWSQCYGGMLSMIDQHYQDFSTAQSLAARWESQLKADIGAFFEEDSSQIYSNSTLKPLPPYANITQDIYVNGSDQFGQDYIYDPSNAYGYLTEDGIRGIAIPDVDEAESYYSIVALSGRQTMGAYVFAIPPANNSDPLLFQKEISSDGNVNTVDVMYPTMPFFLYANPELLRLNMDPLFENQEGGFYPNGYSMHDLGSSFPNATGHVEGNDEYMPVEESGNMILMTYAYFKFSGNTDYLAKHYLLLKQFAHYLIEFSLVPGNQLSTDDFAGRMFNQTNLAIKGIVALKAMSNIAIAAGQPNDAANFSTTASEYFDKWSTYAIDPSGQHTLLAYQWRSSWGLLYNIYPDKLLGLDIIPSSIYTMQSDWYAKVSQIYGIPLDNRHHYTKSDWEMWTAATCDPPTRRLFVNALAYWLNNTNTDRAFSDLHETVDGGGYPASPDSIHFIARPVVGGHFSLLALLKAGQTLDSLNGNNRTVPDRNATFSFTLPAPQPTPDPEAHTGQSVQVTATVTM